MKELNTKAIRIAETDPITVEWAQSVGRFFQNFGMIELLTIEFTARMADPNKAKSLRKKFLSQRLNWIIDNLGERVTEGAEGTDALIETLESIREMAPFRNVLAHGALGLSFPGDGAAASIAGVLNFKPDDDDKETELIGLEEVKEKAAETAVLAGSLLSSLNSMTFEKSQPPPQF